MKLTYSHLDDSEKADFRIAARTMYLAKRDYRESDENTLSVFIKGVLTFGVYPFAKIVQTIFSGSQTISDQKKVRKFLIEKAKKYNCDDVDSEDFAKVMLDVYHNVEKAA